MDPRQLEHDEEKVEDLWDELVFTEALLLHNPDAKDLVTPITALIARAEEVRLGQLSHWRAETRADAAVIERNYALDVQTKRFERALRRELEDRGLDNVQERPEYKTYFTVSLSRITELALEAQIKFMEPWLTHLEKESAAPLKEFVAIFQEHFASGRQVLEERVRAEAGTRSHRMTEIVPLFEHANTARKILAGTLTTRGAERRLPDGWPASFFRRAKRHVKASADQRLRRAVLAVLDARDLSLSDTGKKQLKQERDLPTLARWMGKALAVAAGDDIFG